MDTDSETGVIKLKSYEDFSNAINAVLEDSVRLIRIYSPDFEPEIYGQADVVEGMKQFALQNSNAHIQIVLSDLSRVVKDGHPMMPVIERLPSRFTIRVLNRHYDRSNLPAYSYLLGDKRRVCFRANVDHDSGFAHLDDVATVSRLSEEYAELHRSSQASPELRRL